MVIVLAKWFVLFWPLALYIRLCQFPFGGALNNKEMNNKEINEGGLIGPAPTSVGGPKWTFLDFMKDPCFSSKIGLRQLVATIVLQLHAKFRKDPMTGYREKLRTNGRTNGRTDGQTAVNL